MYEIAQKPCQLNDFLKKKQFHRECPTNLSLKTSTVHKGAVILTFFHISGNI